MIFALHPIHVESVAWVIERKDLLSTVFYLLAFSAYVRFESDRSIGAYAVVAFFFLAAMWSKSVALSLQLALGLWIVWKEGR